MKLIGMSIVVALCAVGCKKKNAEPKAEPAPAAKPAEPPAARPEPVAEPAAKPLAEPADTIAGSRGKSPTAAVQLELPDTWDRIDNDDGGRLETYAAVNDSKFPVDNASFTFEYARSPDGAETDLTKFGAWHEKAMATKLVKSEVIGDAHYFAFAGAPDVKGADPYWIVVKKLGDKLWQCGGSSYQDKDYNKIPKVRDEVLANAKKICASMKL